MTMTFVVQHRVSPVKAGRGQSMRRAGRRLADRLSAQLNMTPQERADRYVGQMPIAVLGPSR